jgi:two-component system LytT family response regulator
MKAVIIDDEKDAIKSLSIIINEYCEGVELIGTANSALSGIKLINELSPDLVLLDVEMPGGTGFDLLEGTANRDFLVIFTTAYEHYSIRAIRANANDYLMKPIDIDELVAAIENAKSQLNFNQSLKNKNLLATVKSEKLTKIPISMKNEYLLLDLEDIQFIKSDGSYSVIYTFDQNYTTAKNLKYYEGLLSQSGFLRISNSHVINVEKVVKYLREDGGMVELRNKVKIAVSKNRRQELKALIGI